MKDINADILLKQNKKERIKTLLDIIKGETKFHDMEDRINEKVSKNWK